jgi:hypothetical protein
MTVSAAWRSRLDQAQRAEGRAIHAHLDASRPVKRDNPVTLHAWLVAVEHTAAVHAAYAAHMRRVRTHQRRHRNRRTT